MARARNIKPSIMDNEDLAELEPLTRLLFIYLWMLADRDGRLEDRPRRIAAQALAYDRTADANKMLSELQSRGVIDRYVSDGVACIQIINFKKHQTPHIREAASTLPAKDACTTKEVPKHNLGDDKALPRSPDSLIPDSLIPDCGGGTREAQSAVASPPPIFSPENRGFIKTERPDLDGEKVWLNFCGHYPPEKCTTANWRKWVRREMRGPVVGVDLATTPATSDPDSKASIESLGLARGMGRWDQLVEPWATYKTRVKTASKGAMQ